MVRMFSVMFVVMMVPGLFHSPSLTPLRPRRSHKPLALDNHPEPNPEPKVPPWWERRRLRNPVDLAIGGGPGPPGLADVPVCRTVHATPAPGAPALAGAYRSVSPAAPPPSHSFRSP